MLLLLRQLWHQIPASEFFGKWSVERSVFKVIVILASVLVTVMQMVTPSNQILQNLFWKFLHALSQTLKGI